MCTTTWVERQHVGFFLFGVHPEEVCPASFDAVDAHVQWVAEAWESEPSTVAYGLFSSREDPCWACSSAEAAACGRDGILSTTRMPDRHEAAHAARGTNCTSLIEEGWATLYANPFEGGEMLGNLREAVSGVALNGHLGGEHYPMAARFVAFLLESYGLDAVKQLCATTLASEAQLDAALQEVLGASLDEVQLALDQYPAWTLGALRQDQACEGADALLSPTSFSIALGCTADGVEGWLGGPVWNHRLVELPEFGAYTFEFDSPQALDLWVELRNCERDGMASTYYTTDATHPKPGAPETVLLTELPAGVYALRVMVMESQAPSSDLSVEITVQEWP
jgi:hypothetical protein